MIIAITGGSGFIGKQLVNLHTKQGDEVRLLTRKSPKKNSDINYFVGDLSNPKIDLFDFVKDVDILYHCAGEINHKTLMEELHINGTQKLVDAAKGRIGRWVQLSSVGAYGKCHNGIITESSIEQPVGIYERTKAESDHIVINSRIPYVILRPSNVFGREMLNQSLFQLINLVNRGMFFYLGKKGALVNYIAVEDVVEALILCGKHKNAINKIYNLSQTIPLEKMINSFSLGLGVKNKFLRLPESPFRFLIKFFEAFPKFPLTTSRINALTNRCTYKSNKIIKELNFKFKYTLEESFQSIAKKK